MTTSGCPRPRPEGAFRFAVRWVASMLSFALFGLGAIVTGLILFPLVSLTSRRRGIRVRRRRWLLQRIFRLYLALIELLGGAAFDIRGAPAKEGNYLVIANHPTLIDAVILLAAFPQCDCIIKHQLLRNPFTRFPLSGLGYISNADTARMLNTAVQRLRGGSNVLVFPEGTRSRPGEPLHFHLAAATMAARAGVACQPVIITCNPITTSKGTPFYRIAEQMPRFRVVIDPPLDIAPVVAGFDTRHAKRALNAFLLDYYNQRLAGASAPPVSPAGAGRPLPPPA